MSHPVIHARTHRVRTCFAAALAGLLVAGGIRTPLAFANGVGAADAQGAWSFEEQQDGVWKNDGKDKKLAIDLGPRGAEVEKSDNAALGKSLVLADRNVDYEVKVPSAVTDNRDYSISLWLKATDATAQKTVLLQFEDPGKTLLYQRRDGTFCSYINGRDIELGKDPGRGEWEYLTLTKDSPGKRLTLYVNGKKVGSGTWEGGFNGSKLNLKLGEHKNGAQDGNERFQGMLDELRIYDSALSPEQVREAYLSYEDMTVAESLAREIEEAQKTLESGGILEGNAEFTALRDALGRAREALSSGNLEQMRAARKALLDARASVRALGPVVSVDPSDAMRPIDDSLFGINHRYSNMGYGTVGTDGSVKADFASLYKKSGFGSLRYPGGTISNNYVWKESIGPIKDRIPQIHGFYNNRGQAGFAPTFGLLEVAEFAEQMGSEIIMVYGIGRGDAQDAADLVEFLNAPKGTNPNGGVAWADKRAELGHEKPFGIRYFEIGNENNQGGSDGTTSQQYWMPNVRGGALEGYVDGGRATFSRQYAVVRGDWNESRSRSTGEPGQEFQCRYALIPRTDENGRPRDAVVPESVKVYVGDELWSATEDLARAGAKDKVYQLDRTTGFFKFGDGAHGAIPAAGQQVRVDYQVDRDGFIDISRAMRDTMRQIDPDYERAGALKVYTSWEANNFVDAMHRKGADALYDGMAVHPYTNKAGGLAHDGNTASESAKKDWYLSAMGLGDKVAAVVQGHVDYMRRVSGDAHKVPVISEYGIFRSTNPLVRSQAHALYVARAIMEYAAQGSPYIQKHCLVDFYSSGADSLGPTQQAVIQAVPMGDPEAQKDGTGEFRFFPTPTAGVFQMLNSTFGDTEVAAALANESRMSNGVGQHSVMASTDAEGNIYVAVVNLGLNDSAAAGPDAELPQKMTLSVAGEDLTGRSLEIKSLAGESFFAENDLEHPDKVSVKAKTSVADAAAPVLKLEPHSFTVIKVGAKKAPQPEPQPQPEKPELTFPDVTDRTEHRDDIYWLARTGVTTGFPDGTFRPYASVTRCDMAAFLYRLVGEPDFEPTAEQKARFKDVDAGTDHAKEIWWLAAQEISTGFGDGTFRPTDTVKRQDMAAFLHRLSQKFPAEKGARAAGFGFADVAADTPHAEDIAWLAATGVSEGWQLPGGGREFRGMSDVARGDMAAFLHRMDDKGLVHVE